LSALEACESKKAQNVALLELEKGSSAFTDYFVICTGSNPRQMQAIADEVQERLERSGARAQHIEGYNQAEWILLDYVDFVVHIFSESARKFYDLERLWKSATRVDIVEFRKGKPRARAAGQRARAPHTAMRKPTSRARKKK
jgi:ribosome-associated protein